MTVTVREYARLTTSEVTCNLDQAQVSPTAFDWLCEMAGRFRSSGAQLLQVEDRRWLKLDSYVGVLETPCGTRLEILPKHVDEADDAAVSGARALLKRMLSASLDLTPREAEEASLQRFELPLLEWVMQRFLAALDHVVKRGVRQDYVRVEEEQTFLRGQLDVIRQMRAGPARAHIFNIRHDLFLPDRAENRLLKSALMRVCAQAQDPDNWRLAHELLQLLGEVPPSRNIRADFRLWRNDRLMAHYQDAKIWCELVLGQQMPMALVGETRGISLLFPMERLFERFVGQALRRHLKPTYKLTEQSTRHSLCSHLKGEFFGLRPDLLIEGQGQAMVLDAKWKRVDASARNKSYGLAQSDFYQLFAYGHKYLRGQGELVLIYPKTSKFFEPLPPFEFQVGLNLRVVPFDLDLAKISGLEASCWEWGDLAPKSSQGLAIAG